MKNLCFWFEETENATLYYTMYIYVNVLHVTMKLIKANKALLVRCFKSII